MVAPDGPGDDAAGARMAISLGSLTRHLHTDPSAAGRSTVGLMMLTADVEPTRAACPVVGALRSDIVSG